jgi:DNA polymerase-1
MVEDINRLILIDGHAMLYRAFFAFPQTLTTRKGELINAVYGFTSIILTVLGQLKPTHWALSFDVGETFRHVEYPEYKAHREKMPEELKEQEPRAYEVLEALNVPIYTKEGFEADDVIGTLARQASELKAPANPAGRQNSKLKTTTQTEKLAEDDIRTLIVTGDMDALQLVHEANEEAGEVHVWVPARAGKPPVEYGVDQVRAKYGLTPQQIVDMKALAGDSSDNIPGIYGIGLKTATTLLQTFGSVEGIYNYLETRDQKPETSKEMVLKPSVLKKLLEGKESAFESQRLATIVTDVPLEFNWERSRVQKYDKEAAVKLFGELEFQSLLSRLPNDDFEESVQEALF